MSKKKSLSRSTMKLRDFHGGTIPTGFVLPSGPGMMVDRGSHDRHSGVWKNHCNRVYGERAAFPRNGICAFENKALYFPNPANIGRNYDDDERKPVEMYTRGSELSSEDHICEVRRLDYEKPTKRNVLENRSKHVQLSTCFNSSWSKGVHDEFPLCPTGSLARIHQNSQGISQSLPLYQKDMVRSRSSVFDESGGLHSTQQMSLGVHNSSFRHQSSLSPPMAERQADRTVSEQAQSALTLGHSNAWMTRMERKSGRGAIFEPHSNGTSATSRAQTIASKIVESSAAEKVSSGRWNSRLSSVIRGQAQNFSGKHSQRQGQPTDGQCLMPGMPGPTQMALSFNSNSNKLYHSSDAIKEIDSHSSKDKYEIKRCVDSRRGPCLSGKAYYLNRGSCGEQSEGAVQKTVLPTFNDRHDSGFSIVKSVKGKYAAANQGSYKESYGVTEPEWVSKVDHVDRLRSTSDESDALLEPVEITPDDLGTIGTSHYDYVEGSSYGKGSDSHRGCHGFFQYSDSKYSNIEKINFTVKESKATENTGFSGYSQHNDASPLSNLARKSNHDHKADFDSGNESLSQHRRAILISTDISVGDTEHRTGMDGRYCSYDHCGDGQLITDGSRGKTLDGGHSLYRYDRKDGPTDYGSEYSFSSERLRSADIMDVSKGYSSQRSQIPFRKGHDQEFFVTGATLEAARDIEITVQKEGAKAKYMPQAPVGLTRKDVPNQISNSRLPHWSRLMVDNTLANLSVQGEVEIQQNTEEGQSAEVLTLDSYDKDVSRAKHTMQKTNSGSGLSEDHAKDHLVDRRKLILNPRSQSLDTSSDSGSARERQTLFGGARPREVVLKERGVPCSVITGIEVAPASGSRWGNQTNSGREEYQVQQTERLTKGLEKKGDAWHSERLSVGSRRYMDVTKRGIVRGKESQGRFDKHDNWCGRQWKDCKRPDVSTQENWPHSPEVSNSSLAPHSLSPQSGRVIPSSGIMGRFGYVHGSSAVQLAQAFSHSVSFGFSNGRSPGHGFGMNYRAPMRHGAFSKEPFFSRLAESLLSS